MTRAKGSDARNSPESTTRPLVLTTLAPAAPAPRGPRKSLAYSWLFTQQSKGVPPRGTHVRGSTQGRPDGYHTMKDHLPDVDPPVSLWARRTERAVHPWGGKGATPGAKDKEDMLLSAPRQ